MTNFEYKIAEAAYANFYRDKRVPEFGDQDGEVQRRWLAVARAVLDKVAGMQ